MLKKSFWVLLVFTLVSCLPVPWTKVDYKSPTTRQYNLQDQPDIDGEHGYLWMKNALIILFMRAHDETIYAGSSPYRLYVVAYGQHEKQDRLKVHDIRVKTASGKAFNVNPTLRNYQNAQLEKQVLAFPAEVAFTPITPENPVWTYATLTTGDEIKPQNQEPLEVSVDLEVITPTGNVRRVIRDTFVPVKKSGWFQSLD